MELEQEKDIHIIKPNHKLLSFNFGEIIKYKDLLLMFVKRDFVTNYKQTILGPVWFFIQPILTTITFTVIFGELAKIGTAGLPKALFYMSGVVCWGYFSECFSKVANVFKLNKGIFGKVYFPRLISPLSIVISGLFKLSIQLLLLISFLAYYVIFENFELNISWSLLLFPVMILQMAVFSMGVGLVISSWTTKYRDLTFLIQFGIQLFMYASAVIYPVSEIPEKYQWLIRLNPMASIIECFRFSLFGKGGELDPASLLYTALISVCLFVIGVLVFNKTERDFMDTV